MLSGTEPREWKPQGTACGALTGRCGVYLSETVPVVVHVTFKDWGVRPGVALVKPTAVSIDSVQFATAVQLVIMVHLPLESRMTLETVDSRTSTLGRLAIDRKSTRLNSSHL